MRPAACQLGRLTQPLETRPMSRGKNLELKTRIRPVARATFLLSAPDPGRLAYRLVSYHSLPNDGKELQSFYLNKAQMIVRAAEVHAGKSDREFLQALYHYWQAAGNKPADEYICVVDPKGTCSCTPPPGLGWQVCPRQPHFGRHRHGPKKHLRPGGGPTNYAGKYVSSEGKTNRRLFRHPRQQMDAGGAPLPLGLYLESRTASGP